MSELINLLKQGLDRIESRSLPKKEEFTMLLSLLELFYLNCYENQRFIELNIDQVAQLSPKDSVYLGGQVLNQYKDQVDKIVSISQLTAENQETTVTLLRQALQSLEEVFSELSREV